MLSWVCGWADVGLRLGFEARCDVNVLGGVSSPWTAHESTYVGLWKCLGSRSSVPHASNMPLCLKQDGSVSLCMWALCWLTGPSLLPSASDTNFDDTHVSYKTLLRALCFFSLLRSSELPQRSLIYELHNLSQSSVELGTVFVEIL